MKYLIAEKGYGEGCDYTIGCGMRWKIIEHDGPITELVEKATKNAIYSGDVDANPEDYNRLEGGESYDVEDLIIVPLDSLYVQVDLNAARDKHNAVIDKLEAAEKENKEKKELERLKQKYG